MENQAARENFCCAHGLSVYIETVHHKVLMDCGPDSRFAENAWQMGVDLSQVDTVVLSHGHYDHAGGLTEFMRLNDTARIYAAQGFDLPHYDAKGAYIGVEPVLAGHPRITVLDGDLQLDSEIRILGFRGEQMIEDAGTAGMTEGSIDSFRKVSLYPEKFQHEQDLLVVEDGKAVLFSGCSHKGIINIANWAAGYVRTLQTAGENLQKGIPTADDPADRISNTEETSGVSLHAIVGGFHLMGVQKEDYALLDHVADELLKIPVTYYTGHCTGADQYAYMKELMGDALQYAAAGDTIII